MLSFLVNLRTRNQVLYFFGWIMIVLFLVSFIGFFVDDTLIKGINAWIKPMKFCLSILIYSWTFGWLLAYAENKSAVKRITWGVVITMTVEIVLIMMQAFRGTTSHFNIYSAFDGMVFSVMGVFIMINTLINAYTLWVFYRYPVTISGTPLLAWRSGLILFFLGGLSGGWMVGIMAHTVGAADGGAGLPFLNWSTVAGDIRAAHFITLHGLQVLPLAAFGASQVLPGSAERVTKIIVAFYFLVCLYLHLIAWMGIPLLSQS